MEQVPPIDIGSFEEIVRQMNESTRLEIMRALGLSAGQLAGHVTAFEQNVVNWRRNRLNTWNVEEVEMPRTRATPGRARIEVQRLPPARVVTPPVFKADFIPGFGSRDMEALGEIHPVLNEYAVTLGRNIYFCNPHGEPKAPYLGPDLHVYFWSRPSQGRIERIVTEQVYGYDLLPGQQDTVIPTEADQELGTMILDPAGVPVALVIESTLYVLFDLPHDEHDEGAGEILRKIMEDYTKLSNPEEVEMRKRASMTKAQERVPEVLRLLITAPAQDQLGKAKRNIDAFESSLREYQNFIRAILAKLVVEQQAVRRIEAENSGESAAARELNALKRIKKVTRISTRMDKLVVELDTVYLTTETARYEIGKFQIEFGPANHFKIKNTTGRIRDYDHPHVLDGDPCLGNMRDILTYAYGGEIAMAVMTTIDYLHSYNPQSAYHQVDNWKEVENFRKPKAATPLAVGVDAGAVAGSATVLATLVAQAEELDRELQLDEDFWDELEPEEANG